MSPDDDRPGLAASAAQLLVRQAVRLPLQAISLGLAVWERTEPVRAVAQRHGAEALQIVAHTPLGRFLPQPDLADGADEEAQRIVAHVRTTAAAAADETTAVDKPADT